MPFFIRFRSTKGGADGASNNTNGKPKLEPYKHVLTHAAHDARSQVPPSAREKDREAIAGQHKRRSQLAQQFNPVLRVGPVDDSKKWPVSHRDVPYVGKEKTPRAPRPAGTLTELSQLQAQRKTRASRRAAHIEPTAEVTYHLGLLPSPLVPAPPVIDLPKRRHPPLSPHSISNSTPLEVQDRDYSQPTTMAKNIQISRDSVAQRTFMGRKSSTSSGESLSIPPPRGNARDSLSLKIAQDPRFHSPNSGFKKKQRLRAAPHDKTGLEDAMANPESFQPKRMAPSIIRNDSAYPSLPMAEFNFGTERPYSPERLRPWLTNTKHNAFQYMTTVNAI